jgi:hypothetical protein
LAEKVREGQLDIRMLILASVAGYYPAQLAYPTQAEFRCGPTKIGRVADAIAHIAVIAGWPTEKEIIRRLRNRYAGMAAGVWRWTEQSPGSIAYPLTPLSMDAKDYLDRVISELRWKNKNDILTRVSENICPNDITGRSTTQFEEEEEEDTLLVEEFLSEMENFIKATAIELALGDCLPFILERRT